MCGNVGDWVETLGQTPHHRPPRHAQWSRENYWNYAGNTTDSYSAVGGDVGATYQHMSQDGVKHGYLLSTLAAFDRESLHD